MTTTQKFIGKYVLYKHCTLVTNFLARALLARHSDADDASNERNSVHLPRKDFAEVDEEIEVNGYRPTQFAIDRVV